MRVFSLENNVARINYKSFLFAHCCQHNLLQIKRAIKIFLIRPRLDPTAIWRKKSFFGVSAQHEQVLHFQRRSLKKKNRKMNCCPKLRGGDLHIVLTHDHCRAQTEHQPGTPHLARCSQSPHHSHSPSQTHGKHGCCNRPPVHSSRNRIA